MYTVKISIDTENRELANKIQNELKNECRVEVLDSRGLFSSSEVIVAIVAATPGIVATIANIIQNYIKHNDGKAVTIQNSKGKRSYTGYSIEEIKELEKFIMEGGREVDE
ncbi:MAG: hypothetical protein K2G55_03545 [Lachnospiraceae bacterium]|nr:hypothetical protein [Lachnospiraceae bacterium]MDE7205276.1 hypothetical protein [Lachnospiraceae bacterium]